MEPNTCYDSQDMAILVETLRSYEKLDSHTRQQTLGALRSLQWNNEMAQNNFRELQGVELLITMYQHLKKSSDAEVIENILYTLAVAVEKSDASKSRLMTKEMFLMIKGAIKTALMPSMFLLLSLTSNNVEAQNLSRTSNCVNKLCLLLKSNVENEYKPQKSYKLCDTLCTTLCAMISSPVNKLSQDICCRLLLPTLVRCLYKDEDRTLLQSLAKLIGSCIIENSEAQTYFCVIGGIRAILATASTWLSNKLQSICDFQVLMHLVNTLCCSYASHAVNKMKVIELDGTEGLLDCLQACRSHPSTDQHVIQLQTTCVMSLLNLLDDNDASALGIRRIQEKQGAAAIEELIACTEDEHLKTLATTLLQKTLVHEANETNETLNKVSPSTSGLTSNSPVKVQETPKGDTVKTDKSTSTKRTKRLDGTFRNDACRCGITMPYVDSHNALQVLCSGHLCSQHTALGKRLSSFIAAKKQNLAQGASKSTV